MWLKTTPNYVVGVWGRGVYLEEVEADGVIPLHGDRASVLRDDLQTLQGSAVAPRQHLRARIQRETTLTSSLRVH